MQTLYIKGNDAGQRLDKFLIKYFKSMPQSLVYKSLRKKRIKVNGKREAENYILKEGDKLDLYINDEFFEDTKPEAAFTKIKTPLVQIVYEDDNIMLVYKPQGMVVHSDDHESVNTLISHVQSYLYQKKEYNPSNEHTFAPALCNRIDRNTQGIVIAAKNAESLRILNEKIKDKEIRKCYLCIVCGIPIQKSGTITSYFIKNEKENKVVLYDNPVPGSKNMITKYRVVETYRHHALVEVELVTGRTHQIRAQMAHIGYPLLGDGKYGILGKNPLLKHQALCSYKLTFNFPTDAGILSYLKGKTFQIEEVHFLDTKLL